jgi:uncharacterized protein YbaR (Trm112 family)
VAFDPAVLEILRCPDVHHAELAYDEAAQTLACVVCGRVFEIRDGIPVLLLDEARPAGAPAVPAQAATVPDPTVPAQADPAVPGTDRALPEPTDPAQPAPAARPAPAAQPGNSAEPAGGTEASATAPVAATAPAAGSATAPAAGSTTAPTAPAVGSTGSEEK